MQTTTPKFKLAQSGLGASQSTQRALPRTCKNLRLISCFDECDVHLGPESGYRCLVTQVVSTPTSCLTTFIALKYFSHILFSQNT